MSVRAVRIRELADSPQPRAGEDCDAALIFAGIATAAAIGYLLWLLRTGRFTAAGLTAATGCYAAFAVGLVFAV
jgi:hypothetical protein